MRRLYITLFMLLIGSASAENEQVSVSLVQDGAPDYHRGAGLELAAQYGRNIVLATELDWMRPTQQSQAIYLQSKVRLLYAAGLESQWYPGASVQWSSADNQFSGWLGGGIQREGLSVFGLFAEGFWQPSTSDFQFRAGLRLFPARFSQLDKRIDSAKPLGATYRGGVSDNPPSIHTTDNSLVTAAPPVVPQKAPESEPVTPTLPVDSPVPDAWYVHLGAFELAESMAPLLERLQGSNYLAQVLRWYDSSRGVYRLMIGPFFNASDIKAAQQDLQSQGYDSFLYQAQ